MTRLENQYSENYAFDFSIHMKKMYSSLKFIKEQSQWCQVCDKIIVKTVYSLRRSDIVCCSEECVDEVC
jgi:hypothetical protein